MRLNLLASIFQALNERNVQYLVVGGVAVIAHGHLRLTKDLDLVIALESANVRTAMDALGQLGYRPKVPVAAADFADPAKRELWRTTKQMLVFQLVSDELREAPIDVFVEEPFDFAAEWARAPRFALSDRISVPVVSLDRLLEMKRRAGRPTDQNDIAMLSYRLPDTPPS